MKRRVAIAVSVLFGVALFGTLGYMIVEGWNIFDSLYMTVITISTTGFTEINKLSDSGRAFTIVLLLVGVGAITVAIGTVIDFFVEGHLTGMLEDRRMTKEIEALSNHHIIAGAGRFGIVVARELADEGVAFVLVDVSEEAVAVVKDNGWLCVHGDATEEEVLRAAGIERASSLLAALDQDADNMFVTVTAKTVNPGIFIVSRSTQEATEPKLIKAGADRVITPNVICGRRMATLVLHPFVSDYLDLVTHGAEVEYRLQEIDLAATSPVAGKSIRESMVRDRFGVFILAIRGRDGVIDTNPSFDRVMEEGDTLVVLGTSKQLTALGQAV